MASLYFVVSILVALVISTTAQLEFPGSCNANVAVVSPFDVGRYLGRWFEIEKYNQTASVNGACITANYGAAGNGSVVVYNTNIDETTGEFRSINGTANSVDGISGKLVVTFPEFGVNSPYWVVSTDYDKYSIVWSCRDRESTNSHFETVWFLSRVRNPTFELRKQVREYMSLIGIQTYLLRETRQVDCPPA